MTTGLQRSTAPSLGSVLGTSGHIGADETRRMRLELLALTESLVAEFADVPAGCVMGTVSLCRSELAGSGLVGDPLLVATQSLARARTARLASRYRLLAGEPGPAPVH